MSKKSKTALVIIAAVIVLAAVAGYGYFYGFTKKMRYNNCVETCEEMMLMESSKAACPPKCSEVTGYTPSKEDKRKDSSEKAKKSDKKEPAKKEEKKEDPNYDNMMNKPSDIDNIEEEKKQYIDNETPWEEREYYCKWVWPQEIIDKNTGEPIYACSSDRPWCIYGEDKKYENSGCCKKYDKETKEKTDCVYLPELLKEAGIR